VPEPSDAGAAAPDIVKTSGPLPAHWLEGVEEIFFATSTRRFAPGPERDQFRERWLGRYLDAPGDRVLLAIAGGVVAGYLVGAFQDPAEQDRFRDLAYYQHHFRAQCRRYPAHLHINLAAAFRNQGLGRRLVAAFAAEAAAAAVTGVHVVTGKGMRNVRFYQQCGFQELATAPWHERQVVFLAMALAGARPGPLMR